MSHPFWRLDLQVTEACNLACPYCFAAERSVSNDMPLSVAQQAISWALLSDRQKVHLTLWGGEPLLRLPLLKAIVADAKQQATAAGKQLSLSMPTNATLLSDAVLDWLDDNNVRIFLSIDGDAETQASRPLRKGGSSFSLAVAGLRRTLQRSRPSVVRMTVTPQNAAYLAHNVDHFSGLGVSELLIYPAFDGHWSDSALASYRDSQRDVANWLIQQLGDCKSPKQVVRLKAWLPLLRRILRPEVRKTEGPIRGCGVGESLVAVDARGRLLPCHRFLFYARRREESYTLGELSSGVSTAFESLDIAQRVGQQRCVDCDCFDLCTIGCVAINYATTGDLQRVPEVACELMRAQIAACQQVVDSLAGDPRLSLYAGLSLRSTLRDVADDLGQRAWRLYCDNGTVS